MCSLRDHLNALHKKGVAVFGISVQDVASHHVFAEKEHLNFPILADADKTVTRAYGVLNDKYGMANRVTFIIGPDGTIRDIDRAMRFDRTPNGLISTHGDALVMALAGNWKAEIGKPVPSFTLPDVSGKRISSTDAASRLTVLVFLSTTCPVTRAYGNRLASLAQSYNDRGVRFLGIDSNRGETPAQIASYEKAQGFSFPVLKDTRGVIADHLRASHTPEVWVVDARGVARYHGAIDDNQDAAAVQTHYLADTLDALLADKAPPQTETAAFGCAIKR